MAHRNDILDSYPSDVSNTDQFVALLNMQKSRIAKNYILADNAEDRKKFEKEYDEINEHIEYHKNN